MDNVTLNPGTSGDSVAAKDVAGVKHQQVILEYLVGGTPTIIDATHGLPVRPAALSTSAVTSVSASASSQTLLAANASRHGIIIFNDSTVMLYIKFGATASLTSCSIPIPPGKTLEKDVTYPGVIDGIWASATGAARITEFSW